MWTVEFKATQTAIDVTGNCQDKFKKHLRDIIGIHDSVELQKTVILGTVYILRKVLTWYLI
jgi:hypothetical protein